MKSTYPQNLVGKKLNEILPIQIAEDAQINVEKALETQKPLEMRFMIPYQDTNIIFRTDISRIRNLFHPQSGRSGK